MDEAENIAVHMAERALSMLATLSAEVAVTREKLSICEHLLVERGILPVSALDDFAAAGEFAAALKSDRIAMISRVFQDLAVEERTA